MRRGTSLLAAFAALLPLWASAQTPSALDLFVRPDKGHCIACHQLPDGAGPATRGNLGPRLEGARMRSLGKPALRQTIGDATRANPDTTMPPFARHRILDAAEIDRLVDFLHALP
jgi:sulfur-oxidizing protein SoxX